MSIDMAIRKMSFCKYELTLICQLEMLYILVSIVEIHLTSKNLLCLIRLSRRQAFQRLDLNLFSESILIQEVISTVKTIIS